MRIGAKIALTNDLLRARFAFRRRGHDPRNILVIRLDGFGDFSLYLPYALALREIYPAGEYKLTLCGNAAWCGIAEKLLPFDGFLALDVRRYMTDMMYRKETNCRVASGGYGSVLQPRFFREPLLEDRLALAAGAETGCAFRIGKTHLHSTCGRVLGRLLYDRLVPCGADRYEVRKNRAFSDTLGTWHDVPRPPLPPPLEGWERGAYAVVLPGSGSAAWAPERWGRALAGVDMRCAVAGTAAEAPLVSAAADSIGIRAVPLAGALSAWDLARLLANAELVVGNDTGGIHFAAWCGVPALAVAGGGRPGWYYPYRPELMPEYVRAPHTVSCEMPCYGCSWQCRLKHDGTFPCLDAVTPEAVAAGIARM